MRRKIVGLYTPYLDVMGGGEKHILSILHVFDSCGYNVVLHWDTDLSHEIKSKLQLSFKNLTFAKSFRSLSWFEKAQKISRYEWFFYVTDGSYFFSSAKHTAIFCMVPQKNLYNMRPFNSLKTANSVFIANSFFTKKRLFEWGIQSKVIYPYVSDEFFIPTTLSKKPLIISVGRFFRHLHAKKQDVLIQTFFRFHKKHPEFSLILAGGVKAEDQSYIQELKRRYPHPYIQIRTNIPFQELKQLYADAMILWHFTGYQIDEQTSPEQVEHLGMTPIEAMASRTVPFCYNAGGPKELIESGKNGFLFSSQEELITQSEQFIYSPSSRIYMQQNAYDFAHHSFNYQTFTKNVTQTFHIK